MVMMSSTGQTVRISMRDIRVLGRNTQGVKLANLKEGDYLVAIQKLEGSEMREPFDESLQGEAGRKKDVGEPSNPVDDEQNE